jgi:NADPH:quinone reductase-like Zn-dependent oxidoreductase
MVSALDNVESLTRTALWQWKNLNFQEAATLSCAALTAWKGLYGLQGRMVMPGDIILTQGNGSVRIFALQVSFQ